MTTKIASCPEQTTTPQHVRVEEVSEGPNKGLFKASLLGSDLLPAYGRTIPDAIGILVWANRQHFSLTIEVAG